MKTRSELEQQLVLKNQGLVRSRIKKYNIYNNYYEDFVSIGNIGLIKAIRSFDESKGFSFSTYAVTCIDNEIKDQFRIDKAKKRDYIPISLNETIYESFKDGKTIMLQDTISDPTSQTYQKQIEDREIIANLISKILNYMNSREVIILLLYAAGISQVEIGKYLSLDQSIISRLLKRSKRNLKNGVKHYQKIFTVNVMDTYFSISFDLANASNSQRILNMLDDKDFLRYVKVVTINDRITLCFPLEAEALKYVAKMLCEFENLHFAIPI